ncbi:MAG: COG2426 family protein [Desulfurococcales archaeon]|nr:COG2426 family protein [Desulfurococcales archaeon]
MPSCISTEALLVYALSLLPTIEGRYALVFGIRMGLTTGCAIAIAILGVLTLSIVLPAILPLAHRIAERLARQGPLSRIARKYLEYSERARHRASRYTDKYGLLGLVIFVAIPLPATGIWTGAIAAFLLGMSPEKIRAGLLVGGVISVVILALTSLGLSL